MKADELKADPWAFGPWCYPVAQVITLSDPIRDVPGMLGFWRLTDAIRADLSERTGVQVESGFTLQQPYATAIAGYTRDKVFYPGPKRIENRPQRRILGTDGLWVALHAGAQLYCDPDWLKSGALAGDSKRSIRHLWTHDRLDLWRNGAELDSTPMWPDAPELTELPMACILGVMLLKPAIRYPTAVVTAYKSEPCDCDLRDRQWNPNTGRCERCGRNYEKGR